MRGSARGDGWAGFPRQQARTRRFTLGEPRSFRVSPDGRRVAYLRSGAGDDPVHALWLVDLATADIRCAADPRALQVDDADLPPEERARRERAREQGAGIVAYTTDRAVERAAFTLGGRLFTVDLTRSDPPVELPVDGPVVGPTLDPTGTRCGFVRQEALWTVRVADGTAVELAADGDPAISWGLAEFVAAEEMGRFRGFWWAPDGTAVLAARVDVSGVRTWHLTDPADPEQPPTVLRYPAAGTPNATVSLHVLDLRGGRVDVAWDAGTHPYLTSAEWGEAGPILAVQSRDQRELLVLGVDPATGGTQVLERITDPTWIDLVGGLPRRLDDGRLLTAVEREDVRRLAIDGVPVGPADLQLRRLVGVADGAALVTASGEDPAAIDLWCVPLGGDPATRLTDGEGVHDGAAAGRVTVVVRRSLDEDTSAVEVRHPGGTIPLPSAAETPLLTPRVELLRLGERELTAALLLPRDRDGGGPLPVLLDPYGGPHAQRVLRARAAYGTSQWFADAGYAVLVVDGRGSPGRGPAWEKAISGDLAAPPLEDQIDALHALDRQRPGLLDLDRVAIRGWSFGGFLAALAVLRRPDVFHAAIAGAPVTDWTLYDTHYTERYLGDPREEPARYRASSLIDDAAVRSHPDVPDRPLLLIHGLADDNVVAAHTLRLSRALLEAGRPHQVLPLVGVTHMTPQEEVAENLLLLQLRFLDGALRPDAATHATS